MTVAAVVPEISYVETGSPATTYAVPFQFKTGALVVERVVAGITSPVPGHSVTGSGANGTASVQLAASVPGAILRIRRVTPRTQPVDLQSRGDLPSSSVEDVLDRAIMVAQEQDASLAASAVLADLRDLRTLRALPGQFLAPIDKSLFAGRFFAGDADGDPVPASGFGADAALRTDLAAPTGFTLIRVGGAGLDDVLTKSAGYFGIDQFTIADQFTKFQTAFAAMKSEGYKRLTLHPKANYRKDGPLLIDGWSLDGQGATLTALADGQQCLRLIGSGVSLLNLTTLGRATHRHGLGGVPATDLNNGLWLGDDGTGAANQALTDFLIQNVHVGSAAGNATKGHAAAAFYLSGAKRGTLIGCSARFSFADGFHHKYGTEDIRHFGPYAEETGDDAFAVVGYLPDVEHPTIPGVIPKNISCYGLTAVRPRARGITVAGGINIHVDRPTLIETDAAGILIRRDASYNTYGSHFCTVTNAILRKCVTGVAGATPQGAIAVGGGPGSDVEPGSGLTVSREARDITITGWIEKNGDQCTGGVVLYDYSTNVTIDVIQKSMTCPALRDGGGNGTRVRMVVDGINDDPFKLEAIDGIALPVGRHQWDITLRNATGKAQDVTLENDTLLAGLDELVIERGEFRTTNASMFAGGANLAKVRWRNVRRDGTAVPGKDYETTALTLQNGWANFGSGFIPATVARHPSGRVFLDGAVKDGGVDAAIATLPVGYRPATNSIFTVSADGGTARIDVYSDGTVKPYSASATCTSLSGISFQAA